jgi:hypothetical protein
VNIAKLTEAIRTRALADNGVGGLTTLVSSVTAFFGPTGATYPYVVITGDAFDQGTAAAPSGFRKEVVTVLFTFHIYGAKRSGMAAIEAVIDRLYGDASAQADWVPTYGFHRHVLTLDGGWTAGPVERVGGDFQIEDQDVLHFSETYRVIISRG